MKTLVRLFVAVVALAVVTGRAFCADAPRDVAVTYAFVPKEQLSAAVKGKREALEVEATWRK